MSKICDHTSVGMMVWKDDKLLLIERMRFPFGYALPAGHVDGDQTFEIAASRELKEEVGLEATKLELVIEGRKENPCRREGGAWHYWKIYQVTATGEVTSAKDEVKKYNWYTRDEIKKMEAELEPVMREWFKELKLI